MNDPTPRWKYRFANYRRALILLREAMEQRSGDGLTQLEKEGTVQRFEFTVELAWKVMKDYLEHSGAAFEEATPRAVIRRAFEMNLARDSAVWMQALTARNEMSHTYDLARFEEVLEEIREHYLPAMEELHDFLMPRDAGRG